MRLGPGRIKLTMSPDNIGENPQINPFDSRTGIAFRFDETSPEEFMSKLYLALRAIYTHSETKLKEYVRRSEGNAAVARLNLSQPELNFSEPKFNELVAIECPEGIEYKELKESE